MRRYFTNAVGNKIRPNKERMISQCVKAHVTKGTVSVNHCGKRQRGTIPLLIPRYIMSINKHAQKYICRQREKNKKGVRLKLDQDIKNAFWNIVRYLNLQIIKKNIIIMGEMTAKVGAEKEGEIHGYLE